MRGDEIMSKDLESVALPREFFYFEAAYVSKLERALEFIASYGGKTMLGDGRFDEGAAQAFEILATIARAALEKGGAP
jgi:hypothetical protein